MRAVIAIVVLAVGLSGPALAQAPVHILHSFTGAEGGARPTGALLQAADGAFYGVTETGGAAGAGTIFRITAGGTFAVLHSFAGGTGGASPLGALIQASDGNLYGTTSLGGARNMGTVFRMTTAGDLTILHSFMGAPGDGDSPSGGVIQTSDGLLRGVTHAGGWGSPDFPFGVGALYTMTLDGLLTGVGGFSERGPNNPHGSLVEGPGGLVYGTTQFSWHVKNGSNVGCGNVYAISITGGSGFSVPFGCGANGGGPDKGLVLGADGNFYGSTAGSGPFAPQAWDVIYRMTPDGTITPLPGVDGRWRWVTHVADMNLYITYVGNFTPEDRGSVSVLSPAGSLTLLHAFAGGATDGEGPAGPLMRASDGNLYGVTLRGGEANQGTVYRVMLRTTAGDVDGDVKADLPMYDPATGTWRILTSGSDHTSSRTIALGGPAYTPVPADYDGDGRLDIAVYHAATGAWHVLTANSGFTAPGSLASWGGIGYVPVPGDYDGDGKADPAVYRAATGDWYVLLSAASFTTSLAVHEGGPGAIPVPGDYDGDRRADVALYEPATGAWRIRPSTSAYTETVQSTLGGPGCTPVPADYDGDGRTDVAVYQQALGTWQVLKSTASGSTPWTLNWGGSGYAPVPGDYDGDGLADLALYLAASGRWDILRSAESYATSMTAVWGNPGDIAIARMPPRVAWNDTLRASDFDGDGVSDIVVYQQTTGEWRVLESASRFSTIRIMNWGGTGYAAVPGDYDGDGITDLAVYHAASSLWSVRLSSSGGTATLSISWGGPGYDPVPGDYDGDLRTDLAVYASATQTWHLLLSSAGFADAINIAWGTPGDRTTPADYDGDGRTDLGVYTPATGQWRVALSAGAYATALSIAWGGTAYTPVARDYDGDGKADLAAVVATTGTWYILLSGHGYTSTFTVPSGGPIDTPLSADYDADGIADPTSYDAASGEWRVYTSASARTLIVARTLGGAGFVPVPR